MKDTGQKILLVAALMLAAGFTLPYFAGRAIPTWGYNVLQIGGIVLLLVGLRLRSRAKKSALSARAQEARPDRE